MRRLSQVLLLLFLSFSAAADEQSELQNLNAALAMLNQQQSIYQQVQMVQELRRSSRPRASTARHSTRT